MYMYMNPFFDFCRHSIEDKIRSRQDQRYMYITVILFGALIKLRIRGVFVSPCQNAPWSLVLIIPKWVESVFSAQVIWLDENTSISVYIFPKFIGNLSAFGIQSIVHCPLPSNVKSIVHTLL